MAERTRGRVGWWPRAVVVAALAALVAPAVRNIDSFPLSTYPMYAGNRGDVVQVATVVGIDERGAVQRLSLAAIASTDDPLVAASAVRQAIDAGRASALCEEVAGRAPPGLVALEVVDELHDVVARAAERPSELARTVHARCEVVG